MTKYINARYSELVENFHQFNKLKHSTVNPKAFPEKGLYMLATILESPKAVKATLAITAGYRLKILPVIRHLSFLSAVHRHQKKKEQTLKRLMQLSLIIFLLPLFATPAEAYIDPGMGSYVFQMLMAAVIGGLFVMKHYWQRLTGFFKSIVHLKKHL